eukprot:501361_1
MCANPRLFHGIDKKIYLPSYVGTGIDGRVRVFVPLSTTSSFEVATNFAGADNKGLIIQFSVDGNTLTKCSKYFSVSWLSDYANEAEQLFIQNYSVLKLYNIIGVQHGYEYNVVLAALKSINQIVSCDDNDDDVDVITDLMGSLIKKIILHQLSYKRLQYPKFASLSEYGRAMCSVYFNNKKDIEICYLNYKQKYSFLFEILFHSHKEWVNIDLINILF